MSGVFGLHRSRSLVSFALILAGLVTSAAAQGQASSSPHGPTSARPTQILFMCPHGAGKSVLASAYFRQLARERGLNVRVDAAGTEPDPVVSPKVAQHLKSHGYQVPIAKPRAATAQDLTNADLVISLGCNVGSLPATPTTLRSWDDVPAPSENFELADETIRKHVAELIEELVARAQTP